MPRYNGGFIGTDGLDAPDAPTIGTPSAGSTQADVAFTAGAAGTTATTEFVATTNDGIGATGTSSPITITGLTNGTSYTARVYAKNSHGTSAASEASASFTPLAEVISGLFSTFLYDGTGSAATINNGINLSGKGGLVWIKDRDQSQHHALFDTSQGATKYLKSSSTSAVATRTDTLTSFNSNGFSLGNDSSGALVNSSGQGYVSWTFRKEPKFFDIVTYTGNGSNRTISHNLSSAPGMILIKNLSQTDNWAVFHRSQNNETIPENYTLALNSTAGDTSGVWNGTLPTSSVFSVGTDHTVNANGENYVAYLFAHNNNDGGFGPDSEDIIKCGHFQTDGNEDATIDLGFEPQWVLFKRYNSSTGGDWNIYDSMRGMHGDFLSQAALLEANTSDAEDATTNRISVTSTGFKIDNYGDNRPFIYVAIRRPDMSTPTSASEVFAINTTGTNDSPNNNFTVGFDPDLSLNTQTNGNQRYLVTRLLGNGTLKANDTTAVNNISSASFFGNPSGTIDLNTNFWGTASNVISWSWKRARGYFDVVAYTGNSVAGRTINHNLGVAPEMMWVKRRSDANNWTVYHKGLDATAPEDYGIYLDDTAQRVDSVNFWNDTAPTSSVFTVGAASKTNADTATYIAYLFATVAGVSKVGSYTANGSAQNIDCGFTNGTKWVMIRRSSGTGNWFLIDTTRGLVAGNDTLLELNTTSNQDSGYDDIDPLDAGFTITAYGGTAPYLNINGETYIFYAIAA